MVEKFGQKSPRSITCCSQRRPVLADDRDAWTQALADASGMNTHMRTAIQAHINRIIDKDGNHSTTGRNECSAWNFTYSTASG
ncbi:hypothetical protein HK100_008967, partial [Physocladia obscura]